MTASMPTLTCAQAREFDRRATADFAMPSILLMENAGRGVVDVIEAARLPGPAVIFCGRGNNAGDGFVIARHLELRGVDAHVLLFADPADLKGDAAVNFEIMRRGQTPRTVCVGENTEQEAWQTVVQQAGFLVDALLGTGVQGAPRPPLDVAVAAINAAGKPVVAVDLPTGLNADTGQAPGAIVAATITCTFVAAKPGLLLDAARPYVGQLHIVDIGAPRKLVREMLGVGGAS